MGCRVLIVVLLLIAPVLCCSLEYHSHMVSDAVKRVIKQGKVSLFVLRTLHCGDG